GGRSSRVAAIYGEVITRGELVAHLRLAGVDRFPKALAEQLRLEHWVQQGLIERALLARAARKLGFRIGDDEVMLRLAEKGDAFVSWGMDTPLGFASRRQSLGVVDAEGRFDKELARRIIQGNLQRTVGEFAASQGDAILAHRMQELIASTTVISPEEVWRRYQLDHDQLRIKYVRFSSDYGRTQVSVPAAKLAAWQKRHKDELERAYKDDKEKAEQVKAGTLTAEAALQQVAEQRYRQEQAKRWAKRNAKAVLVALQQGKSFQEATAQWAPASKNTHITDEGTVAASETGEETAASEVEAQLPVPQESELFGRQDSPVSGPFSAKPLVQAAFALPKGERLARAVVQLGDDVFVFRVEERRVARRADFRAQERHRYTEKLRAELEDVTVKDAIRRLRQQAEKDDALHVEQVTVQGDATPSQ
ncbi:MAG: hypothetical protein ACPGUV_05760, partial [Polyangiales bacterium]